MNGLKSAIEEKNLYETLKYIEEQMDALRSVRSGTDREKTENVLRLLIQEIERIKNGNPAMDMDITYNLGRLDGFCAAHEEMFRERWKLCAVIETLVPAAGDAENILRCLASHGGMRHVELSGETGIPYRTLTERIKPILYSGAVRSSFRGTDTTYDMTDAGKAYLLYRSFVNAIGGKP